MTMIHGIIHGRTIELQDEPGLPDGQAVTVTIQRIEQVSQGPSLVGEIPPVEFWMDRLVFDSTVSPGERIVKGTRLGAESLVAELEEGRSDEEMLCVHPELSKEDLQPLRHYAKSPIGLRRSFGGWAEDAEDLDKYLEWTRQQRKIRRRVMAD
jgi:uncharacterized protein (DUF433 family)